MARCHVLNQIVPVEFVTHLCRKAVKITEFRTVPGLDLVCDDGVTLRLTQVVPVIANLLCCFVNVMRLAVVGIGPEIGQDVDDLADLMRIMLRRRVILLRAVLIVVTGVTWRVIRRIMRRANTIGAV
ncbi:hypothetical protein EB75_19655 [Mycobacterium sp. ST-F2]|nr:hypothetical protein EB75_19655 [Mycobacterium sp. ST-F2]